MFRLVVLVLLQIFASIAQAGVEEALALYQKQDYDQAFLEFMRMAEIGDHAAQFNVGVMYYRGQSVSQDVVQGYAWMALASQKGDKHWSEIGDKVYAALDDEQKKRVETAKRSLFAQYSDAVVAQQLAPEMSQADDIVDELQIKKKVAPLYPNAMLQLRKIGWVDVIFTVATDGTTRNHMIIYASDQGFVDTALTAVKQWQYQPPTIKGQPVETYGKQVRVNYVLNGMTFDKNKLQKMAQLQREKAEAGGAADRYLYGYFLDVLPTYTHMKLEGEDFNRWYLRSAMEGYGPAQFSLAKNLLYGRACTADTAKSLRWLELAAEQGQPDAEYLLAIEMLSGVRVARNPDVAIKWLRKSAEANNQHAQLKLAWVYATNADEKLRNAQLAKQYVDNVGDGYIDHRTLFEVRAAVAAVMGDFNNALQWQSKARDEAKKYELPVEGINAKFASYQSGKPWVEPISG